MWKKNFQFLGLPKMKLWSKKTPNFFHEKKTGWCPWALIFCMDVHMELTPLSPLVRIHPPEPDPLCVDVINGWPLRCLTLGQLVISSPGSMLRFSCIPYEVTVYVLTLLARILQKYCTFLFIWWYLLRPKSLGCVLWSSFSLGFWMEKERGARFLSRKFLQSRLTFYCIGSM